jgi:hypothetical protein
LFFKRTHFQGYNIFRNEKYTKSNPPKNQKKNLFTGQVIYFLNSLLITHTILKILGAVCGHVDTPSSYICYQSQTMAHSLLKYQQNMWKNYFTAWHLNKKMCGFYTHTKKVTMQVKKKSFLLLQQTAKTNWHQTQQITSQIGGWCGGGGNNYKVCDIPPYVNDINK